MHSEGILAGEMKHGPLALVDEHMPMIVLATQDRACNKMHSVVQQLRARGAAPLVVCNVGDDQIAGVCEGGESRLIRVSSALPCLPSLIACLLPAFALYGLSNAAVGRLTRLPIQNSHHVLTGYCLFMLHLAMHCNPLFCRCSAGVCVSVKCTIQLNGLLTCAGAQGGRCSAANCECGPSAAIELSPDSASRLQRGPAP